MTIYSSPIAIKYFDLAMEICINKQYLLEAFHNP